MIKKITFAIGVLVLAGCTATPEKVTTTKPVNPPTGTNTQKKKVNPPASGVKITPYDQKEIKRQTMTPQVVVPEQKVQQKFSNDGAQLPAFRTLMQKTQTAYKSQQFAEA